MCTCVCSESTLPAAVSLPRGTHFHLNQTWPWNSVFLSFFVLVRSQGCSIVCWYCDKYLLSVEVLLYFYPTIVHPFRPTVSLRSSSSNQRMKGPGIFPPGGQHELIYPVWRLQPKKKKKNSSRRRIAADNLIFLSKEHETPLFLLSQGKIKH